MASVPDPTFYEGYEGVVTDGLELVTEVLQSEDFIKNDSGVEITVLPEDLPTDLTWFNRDFYFPIVNFPHLCFARESFQGSPLSLYAIAVPPSIPNARHLRYERLLASRGYNPFLGFPQTQSQFGDQKHHLVYVQTRDLTVMDCTDGNGYEGTLRRALLREIYDMGYENYSNIAPRDFVRAQLLAIARTSSVSQANK